MFSSIFNHNLSKAVQSIKKAVMSIITTVKDKILKNSILARILPPARIQGHKAVLARKIEKQGLGSTPGSGPGFGSRIGIGSGRGSG